MKFPSAILSTVMVFTFLVSSPAAEKKTHLFILSGQSNMLRLNENLTFIPDLKKAFPDDELIFVKDSEAGKIIKYWYKRPKDAAQPPKEESSKKSDKKGDKIEGTLYDRLMEKVRAAIKDKKYDTVTLVWMQGEADGLLKKADYGENLKGLIQQFETDLGRKDLNVVIGRISDAHMDDPSWTGVRDVQVKVAGENPRWTWIDTDDLNGEKNESHYTAEGFKTLGTRFAQKSVELIQKNK